MYIYMEGEVYVDPQGVYEYLPQIIQAFAGI